MAPGDPGEPPLMIRGQPASYHPRQPTSCSRPPRRRVKTRAVEVIAS